MDGKEVDGKEVEGMRDRGTQTAELEIETETER
jgi:hypothetical protein